MIEDHLRQLDQQMADLLSHHHDAVHRLAEVPGARFARPALVNGTAGVIVAPRGRLFRMLHFSIVNRRITEIDVIGEPASLRQLDLAVPNNS